MKEALAQRYAEVRKGMAYLDLRLMKSAAATKNERMNGTCRSAYDQ